MATINRIGFGQVEPNHLSAQRTSQIYAQLPADALITILENGQFAKYNYAEGKVDFSADTSSGEWMLVFNEIKNYETRDVNKDFALQSKNFTPGSNTITHGGVGPFPGQMTPRLFKTNVGDIFTTNTLEAANTSKDATVTGTENYAVGDSLGINARGFLSKVGDVTGMIWTVVKIYTLADGQAALKVQRTK